MVHPLRVAIFPDFPSLASFSPAADANSADAPQTSSPAADKTGTEPGDGLARISQATQLLADCLGHYPRQQITRCLSESGVSVDAFCSAEFQRSLWHDLKSLRVSRRQSKPHAHGLTADNPDDWVIGWFDDGFPELLRHIADPPLLLYGRGNPALLREPAVAIVGARRCTSQGRRFSEQLASQLASCGLVVVSGLAYGIDVAAHTGVLQVGARTIAVLGSGLDQLYPAGHQHVYQHIVNQNGAVISEYPPAASARRHHFVERNRLVSGLSRGVVVVEAGLRSGSLTTAGFAAEQGREVMAMPGPVSSMVSRGCHQLIQQGAALVTSAEDVFAALGIQMTVLPQQAAQTDTATGLSALATATLKLLSSYPKTVDELVVQVRVPHQQMLVALSELEVAGFVEQGAVGYIATS